MWSSLPSARCKPFYRAAAGLFRRQFFEGRVEELKEKFRDPQTAIRWLFAGFTLLCLLAAVISAVLYSWTASDVFEGLGRICTQSGQTVKSYFDISYGGFAGTFLNAAIVCAVCAALYSLPGSKPDGVSVLAFFLTAGFCFWGTTILNIWFSFAGVALFAAVKKKSLGSMANAFLFSTGLAPLITEMLFRYPGESWHGFTALGFVLALAVGVCIGFVFPAVLPHSPKMHKGYDLYNAAVPIGLTAFFLRALLYKVFTPAPPTSEGVGLGDSFELVSFLFCGVVFGLAIIWGLAMGGGRDYGKLLRASGYNADFGTQISPAAGVLNFGVYGVFIVLYYCAVGAVWNAATLGCVFCMVCCCFKGSHPLNVWPIMVGYVAASFAAKFVCSLTGAEFSMAVNAQAIVIGLCFANGLSPVAGEYGWLAGVLFGMAHYTLVTCVPLLHGAFCLYNGGFTAAFCCFLFVPVLEAFCKTKTERKQLKAGK